MQILLKLGQGVVACYANSEQIASSYKQYLSFLREQPGASGEPAFLCEVHGRIALVRLWRNWQTRQVQDLIPAREWWFDST